MIHVFIGTKAQLIKMAPIMRELQRRNIEYNFIFSGQHQETIHDLRENFGIKDPDIILHNGRDITGIIQMSMWMLKILCKTLFSKKSLWKRDKNGIVLNHGDTFSTLLGSLLAKLHGHRCAHVESGLRSFDIFNPFPEELVRRVTFLLTDIYYCPTDAAIKNVEKYRGKKVLTNGNTLYDALSTIKNQTAHPSLEIPNTPYAIASFHRFENIFNNQNLEKIIDIITETAQKIKVLIIAHKPTLIRLQKNNLLEKLKQHKNIELRPRYDYKNFIKLVIGSNYVITDGGSNQEECYYLGKPCLIIRSATERNEGLGSNAVLSNFDKKTISLFTETYQQHTAPEVTISPSPSEIIVEDLITQLHP